MKTGDEVLCVAAAHHFGMIWPESWPMVAAHLVAAGLDGPALVALACLSSSPSLWEVDSLIPTAFQEMSAPDLTDGEAAELVARLVSTVTPPSDLIVLKVLADLADRLTFYDDLILHEAWALADNFESEWPKTDSTRRQAEEFESRLRSLPPVSVPSTLARTLVRCFARYSPNLRADPNER